MSDYLESLVARTLRPEASIRPRVGSRFEPPGLGDALAAEAGEGGSREAPPEGPETQVGLPTPSVDGRSDAAASASTISIRSPSPPGPDRRPVVADPTVAEPAEARPGESRSVAERPIKARPVEARSTEAQPVAERPVDAWPVEARPDAARPDAARPDAARLDAARPVEARRAESAAPIPATAPGSTISIRPAVPDPAGTVDRPVLQRAPGPSSSAPEAPEAAPRRAPGERPAAAAGLEPARPRGAPERPADELPFAAREEGARPAAGGDGSADAGAPLPAATIRPASVVRADPAAERSRGAAADAAPTIRVTIGRVEVRAAAPEPPAAPEPARPREPLVSLDAYLQRRDAGRR